MLFAITCIHEIYEDCSSPVNKNSDLEAKQYYYYFFKKSFAEGFFFQNNKCIIMATIWYTGTMRHHDKTVIPLCPALSLFHHIFFSSYLLWMEEMMK